MALKPIKGLSGTEADLDWSVTRQHASEDITRSCEISLEE